ncbi:MAG: ChaN family lipoprotein [Deltaproteobacteria bacterium]|nr:ChaN family lipoprotein [Deltaproteobacteria bacterium]
MRVRSFSGARPGCAAVSPSLLARLLLEGAVIAAASLWLAGAAAASPWWGTKAHDLAGASVLPALPPFQSPLSRDHPLSGRLFDVRRGRFIAPSGMLDAFSRVDLVLLGEQHDNVDHHRLQAWLIDAITRGGRRPRVVFEMIDVEKQSDVDRSLQVSPLGVDQLGAAVNWDKSGWPAFAIYRPVFATVISHHLPIVAAGLSRTRLAAADFKAAESAAGEDPALRLELPRRLRDLMADDIVGSHCGYAHESMIAAMITVQRRRDVAMARALLAAGRGAGEGAVLVAGFGHSRADYAVPMVLHELDPSASVRSLGFIEALPGGDEPADYADALRAEVLPFDYVWFTPRANDDDPCEKFRSQLETMESKAGAKHAADGSADEPSADGSAKHAADGSAKGARPR